MAKIVSLIEYLERKEQENDYNFIVSKYSPTRIGFFLGGYRTAVTLNRENFEKLVENTRRIMRWDDKDAG